MKRALVTGGTGFVGANLVRRLLRDGHEVHLLVRPGFATWRIQAIRDAIHLHQVDISDGPRVNCAVDRIRPDWVFHLAVHGAYSSQTDLHSMLRTNVVGTINLVEACLTHGFEAFVNTGSSSEYGFKDRAPSESEWLEPNSHYAVTKASATMFCRYTAQSRCVHLPTLRLYSVYGPYEEPARLIPTLIVHGLDRELPPLVGPDTCRDYVYVDDVIEAYILAAARSGQGPGAVYNVGTGTQTRLAEVVQFVRRIMNISAEPAWGTMPARIWDTNVWVSNSDKARNELGWSPRMPMETGLEATVGWFNDNPLIRDYYVQRLAENLRVVTAAGGHW